MCVCGCVYIYVYIYEKESFSQHPVRYKLMYLILVQLYTLNCYLNCVIFVHFSQWISL